MSRDNASPNLVTAARKVFEELTDVFESYPEAVVIGGFVPYLLIPQETEIHEGTVDIDIVLDHLYVSEDRDLTLHDLLERLLFQQDCERPFRYSKTVNIDGQPCSILLELLGGGEPVRNDLRRYRSEDVHLSVIPGLEIAFYDPVCMTPFGENGRKILIASMPAFLTMKANALANRDQSKKSKDAYDIVYCIRNYPDGIKELARQISDAMGQPLIAQGVDLLRELFKTIDAIGPLAYSQRGDSPEQAALLRREAYERVRMLTEAIESIAHTSSGSTHG